MFNELNGSDWTVDGAGCESGTLEPKNGNRGEIFVKNEVPLHFVQHKTELNRNFFMFPWKKSIELIFDDNTTIKNTTLKRK